MNIQEKAEKYAHELHKSSIDFNGSYNIAKNAYVAGYNEAKRWIPIEDLLPYNVLDIVFNSTANIYLTEPVLAKNENGDIVLTKMFRYHSHIKFQWIATGKIIEWREI